MSSGFQLLAFGRISLLFEFLQNVFLHLVDFGGITTPAGAAAHFTHQLGPHDVFAEIPQVDGLLPKLFLQGMEFAQRKLLGKQTEASWLTQRVVPQLGQGPLDNLPVVEGPALGRQIVRQDEPPIPEPPPVPPPLPAAKMAPRVKDPVELAPS